VKFKVNSLFLILILPLLANSSTNDARVNLHQIRWAILALQYLWCIYQLALGIRIMVFNATAHLIWWRFTLASFVDELAKRGKINIKNKLFTLNFTFASKLQ
jgi:hypothetical protein